MRVSFHLIYPELLVNIPIQYYGFVSNVTISIYFHMTSHNMSLIPCDLYPQRSNIVWCDTIYIQCYISYLTLPLDLLRIQTAFYDPVQLNVIIYSILLYSVSSCWFVCVFPDPRIPVSLSLYFLYKTKVWSNLNTPLNPFPAQSCDD